jgi:hypothetical protein
MEVRWDSPTRMLRSDWRPAWGAWRSPFGISRTARGARSWLIRRSSVDGEGRSDQLRAVVPVVPVVDGEIVPPTMPSPFSPGSVVGVGPGVVVGLLVGVGVVVVDEDPPLDPSPGSVVPGEVGPGVVPPGLPSEDPAVPDGDPSEEFPVPFVDWPFDELVPLLVVPFNVLELEELPELVEPPEPFDEAGPLDRPLATTGPRLSARLSCSLVIALIESRSAADRPASWVRRSVAMAWTWATSWAANATRRWARVPLADASAGEVTGRPRA